MSRSHSQINTLLIVVAILAIAGGLAIVFVTSPQSWDFGPGAWLQLLAGTPTSVPPTETYTPTATLVPPTATATATERRQVNVPTVTPIPSETATPEASASETPSELPADVIGLAVVSVQGAASARVRDVPNGDTVVAAVTNGTEVQLLNGRVEIDGVVWLKIRLPSAQEGWIADYLLQITQTPEP